MIPTLQTPQEALGALITTRLDLIPVESCPEPVALEVHVLIACAFVCARLREAEL